MSSKPVYKCRRKYLVRDRIIFLRNFATPRSESMFRTQQLHSRLRASQHNTPRRVTLQGRLFIADSVSIKAHLQSHSMRALPRRFFQTATCILTGVRWRLTNNKFITLMRISATTAAQSLSHAQSMQEATLLHITAVTAVQLTLWFRPFPRQAIGSLCRALSTGQHQHMLRSACAAMAATLTVP